MPLGILLAAVWVEMLTPAEIAVEIARSLDFLETKMRDMPQRQQSIRAAFDHSWNLLTRRERDIFQQLSIFRGHFSRQAAQTVTGASLHELMALVNKSLLRLTATGRYLVHELLRQYAAEKLDQSVDGGKAARNQHSAYYVAMLQQFEEDLKGPRQQTELAKIEVEGENIGAAWNWALSQQQVKWLSQAMDGLGYFYNWRGRYQEGEAAFRMAVIELERSASIEPGHVQAKLATWQAVFSYQLGWVEIADQLLQESLTILDDLDPTNQDARATRAFTLLQMGEISREIDRQAARRLYQQSLALYQTLNDSWGTANTLASLGWLIQHFGAYDEAKQLYAESLTLRQLLEDRWGIANSLISLGSITLYQGHPEEAQKLVHQSITLHRDLDDRSGIAYSLSKLGETLIWLGRYGEAHAPLAESKLIYDNLALRDRAAFSVAILAHALIHLGEYEAAYDRAKVALTDFQKLGSRRGMGYALLMMGWAYLCVGQTAEAQQFLQESLTIYQEIGQRDELAQALALSGYAAYRLDDPSQAQHYLIEGLSTASQIRAFMPMMLALPAMSLLFIDQDRHEQAIELYALASRYPFVANSQWFEDMAGQQVTAINLPLQIVSSAQERGKAGQLEAMVAELLGNLVI
jgi:tetratricopeptide (TPR) repeat protein